MINLSLTVREALYILERCGNDDNLREKVVVAIEAITGENTGTSVTITGGINYDNRIPCIKVFRTTTGFGLRESKDWIDVVLGYFSDGRHISGKPNTIKLDTPNKANALLVALLDLGCLGYIQ